MGIFDWFQRRESFGDPQQLRAALFDAAAGGDSKRFERLCRDHRRAILDSFADWRRLPPGLMDQHDSMNRYAQGLIAVARYFADHFGQPSLLELLKSTPEDNPIVQWQSRVQAASGLLEEARYAEAVAALQDCLIDTRGLRGTGAESWRAITFQLLAESRFHQGGAREAIEPSRQALHLCETLGDARGIRRCLDSLYEFHRWLGLPGEAAAFADRIAGLCAPDEASEWRRQAEIVRAGEPLVRVVVGLDGRTYEVEDAPPLREGRVEFILKRNRLSTGSALRLSKEGMTHGSQGRLAEALDSFRRAAQADPYDPQPRYQAAVTLLHLRRPWDAVTELQETEARAPGWFQCRADLWFAEQLASEALPYDIFPILRGLDSDQVTPQEKIDLAESGLRRFPRVPPLHLELGRALRELGRATEAEEWLRRGLAVCEEPDTRTRLLVELAMTLATPERARLFEEAASLRGNLVAGAQASLLLRS